MTDENQNSHANDQASPPVGSSPFAPAAPSPTGVINSAATAAPAVHQASHPMIELKRLHRFFGPLRAVQDISFRVPAGEVFGYIGPNGAGKTTSMRILATLDLPTFGDACVDGFSVVDDPDRVRRRLGFMPDYFSTYPNVNCEEYLDFFARAYGLVGRERTQAIRRAMDFTGLQPLAEKPIDGLSKGMKQRLCLGRSMVHDPSVLILDEPAAGLDPRARIELRTMIRELAAEGKAVLVSSHILTELAEVCDRVGIIEQGRLLATGSVDEILEARRQSSGEQVNAVRIRVLGGAQPLANWLTERGGYDNLRIDGELIHFNHRGTRNDEAALLKEIVLADFAIVEFGAKTVSLEDVFMQVTRGAIQ